MKKNRKDRYINAKILTQDQFLICAIHIAVPNIELRNVVFVLFYKRRL